MTASRLAVNSVWADRVQMIAWVLGGVVLGLELWFV